ncbi:integrase [Brachybacterium sacelli]|uniref:Integrase n=2 Tax=Brachybacterium sacelli TaxID=173364 RepID=A0ABS4X7P5_9MICO|nr:integrase [Brachybacterium sacelli]MBP2384475.1 integrase [Brachybacterium sacelli]
MVCRGSRSVTSSPGRSRCCIAAGRAPAPRTSTKAESAPVWPGLMHHCCNGCNTGVVDQNRPGVSPLRELRNVRALDEHRFVFDAMLSGWADQQSSRGLSERTIGSRERVVRSFEEFAGRYPWEWSPGDLEDYTTRVMSRTHPAARSTIRGYHSIIRLFCDYLTDPRYQWSVDCEERFGTTPQQVCHEWNTLAHLLGYEGRAQRRALTYDELETFFSAADQRVEVILRRGRKGALAALRDSQIFKTIYAYGLRRAEAVRLDVADLRPNGAAPRFGRFGAVEVRWGKGAHGSGPRRRSVHTSRTRLDHGRSGPMDRPGSSPLHYRINGPPVADRTRDSGLVALHRPSLRPDP